MVLRLLILCGLSLWAATDACAAILKDSQSQGTCAGCPTLTIPHTVGSGNERYLDVTVLSLSPSAMSNSITYGGVPVTAVPGARATGSCYGYFCEAQKFQLVAPAVGLANVVVTNSTNYEVSVIVTSYAGVDQVTPNGTPVPDSGSSATPEVSVTSSTNEVIAGALVATWAGGSVTPTGGATSIAGLVGGGGYLYAAASYMPGLPTVTYGWQYGSLQSYAILALPLRVSTGGGLSSSELLKWTDNSGNENAFRLQWKHTLQPTYGDLAMLPPNTQQYTVQYTTETDRCYRVRAENAAGTSTYSNELCSAIVAAGPIRPTLVAPVSAGGLSDE